MSDFRRPAPGPERRRGEGGATAPVSATAHAGPAPLDEALSAAPSGAVARIRRIGGDVATRRHLAALGVRSGALIDVVRNLGPDGVVLGLVEDRLSLPRSLAGAIRVEPILRHGRGFGAVGGAEA